MKYSLHFIIPVVIVIAICSCKNSPSTNVMGEYEGNYIRDTLVVGSATANVVEVNSLTVNIVVDLENDPDFNLNGVAVYSDTSFYELEYNGTEGVLSGTVLSNNMNWTLMSTTDTITFNGSRIN